MKKLALFLVLLLCLSHTYAQTASLEIDIKDNDKEWPVCSRPTHLQTETVDGYTRVSWDAVDQPSDYEIKLVQEQTRAIMLEATVSTNFVSLDENIISKNKNYFLKLRRKCLDKLNNTIYSDWVVQAINSATLCDDVDEYQSPSEYQIYGSCVLLDLKELPCDQVEDNAYYSIWVNYNSGEANYFANLGQNLQYQFTLPNNSSNISNIRLSWHPSGTPSSYLISESIPLTDFDIDEEVFDLSNCEISNPCVLPQFLSANQYGDDVILNIDGISQDDFDGEILGVGTAELHINGWADSGYTEFEIPYYNVENNTGILNWEGVLGFFTGASEINVSLVYTDLNGNTINCTEEYTLPVNVDSPYCDILQLLLTQQIDDQSFSLSFTDDTNPNYLTEQLNDLNLTYAQASGLFRNNIREIRYRLENTNETIYVTNIQQLQLSAYEATFDPVQINESFNGTVRIEYIFHDLTSEFCYITPITFEDEETPENELPEYECGSVYDVPNITNQNELDILYTGDLVYISGIAFRVTSVSGTNGNYSGQGELANPFTDKPILITYHSLTVNDEYHALTGEVNGEMGDPTNYPDFYIEPDTFNIGGEICLPPPPPTGYDEEGFNSVTGLNDRGFNQDSIHHETGTIYDPNGFDMDGNHVDTEGPFNEQGCDMHGYDEYDNLCENDETVITEFIDSVNQTIDTDITNIVDNLLDSLDLALGNDCSGLRSEVSNLISELQFDPKYIVGENNEYLNSGMSANFASEPHPLVLNTERNPQVKLLEEKHVDLYHCDKNFTKISELLSAIQSVSTEEIIDLVKQEMKSLTNYQVDQFKTDPQAFQAWIIFTIEKLLKETYGIAQVEYERKSISPSLYKLENNNIKKNLNSDYYATASIDEILIEAKTTLKKENYWLFGQGRQKINGIDRALYLEELYNQMMLISGGSNETGVMLPIRIRKERDNKNYDIYLDGLKITPSGASINATFIYTEPNSGRKLVFKAQDLAFGAGGILGESKLSLESFIELRLTNAAMLRINPGENTFVTWDCTGFTSMGINADIELCRNLVVPLNPTTYNPLPDPQRYKVNFTTQFDSWSDIYIEINDGVNKPFIMVDYPDMIWNVSDLTFDFSDHTSPGNVILNPDYSSPHTNGSNFLPSWKGIHFGWIEVEMQSQINSNQPIRIGASDIIIDDTGVSGLLYGENILAYENGNASGWQISINSIDINVLQNHINGGSLGGKLGVPVFKDPMDYSATILQGGYYDFVIKPNVLDSFDIYGAEVKLDSNSYVQAKLDPNSEFELKATLHGTVSINKELGGVELKYNDIRFDNFEVSNISPYFSPGSWNFPNSIGADLYGFGVNLRDFNQFKNENDEKEVGLSTIVDLNLAEALGIKATGGISIIGKMHEDALGRQKWKYDRMTMDQFAVDAQFSAGHIKGSLSRFEGNNDYGKGFQGFLNAKFKGLGEMTAMGLFGSKGTGEDKYKYFFVDALVAVDGLGIPVGPLSINGFAGGASYHMDRDYSISNLTSVVNTSALPPIGTSFSGTVYTPNSERGLGLKAGALISTTGTKSLFNGLVSFGILFNEVDSTGAGGIEEIDFNGMGQFLSLSPIESSGENQDTSSTPNISSSLTAFLNLNYNFTDNIFDGKFSCFLNTPGDFIKGGMDQHGKLVHASAYFSPDKWYVYLGLPSAPCKIKFQIPGVNVQANVESYLDVGTDVPEMKPLPNNVRKIAYKVADNKSIRSSGAGFVFGSRFNLDAHMNFGIASGELNAGVGFDLMVRNYPGAFCLGDHPSDEIGINGWYGMGQMWAYVEGKVKIFGISVLEAGIAAVLQAQLPNPTFAQATVGVRFKAFFKTWRKSLKISIGEQCTIISEGTNNEIGMNVIQFIDPVTGTQDIEPDASIRVITAIPIGEKIELPVLNSDVTHEFKVEIEEMTMFGKYGNYILNPTVSESGTEILFGNVDQFYDHDSITAIVHLKIFKDGSEVGIESDTTVFIVGKGYDFIAETNVASAYPLDGMSNFYKKEYNKNKGYLYLKKGMPGLFYDDEKEILVQLTSDDGDEYFIDLEYFSLERKIEFDLDPNILTNGKLYQLKIVEVEEGNYNTHNSSSNNTTRLNSFMSNSNVLTAEDPKLENFKEIYSLVFRVSIFDTFEDKLNIALQKIPGNNYNVQQEVFDDIEIEGNDETHNLIRLSTNFSSSFKNNIEHLYSQEFPIHQLDVSTTLSQLWIPSYCTTTIGENFDFTSELVTNSIGFEGGSQSIITQEDFGIYNYNQVGSQIQRLRFNVQNLVDAHWLDVKSGIIDCLGNVDNLFDQFEGNTAFSLDSEEGSTPDNLGEIELINDGLEYIYKHSQPILTNNDKNIYIKYITPGGIHTSTFRIQF